MTIVVGIAPQSPRRAALHLAGLIAHSADDDVLLCAVIPPSWPPSPARIDAEYRAYVAHAAREGLEQARERLPGDVPVTTLVHYARSAPAGLLEVADQHDTTLIVVDSSPSGPIGQIVLGSVNSRLLHSSHYPVAVATRGFRCRPELGLSRATAAFGGTTAGEELVVAAAGVAARLGVPLRIVSFAVQPRPPYTSGVGREAVGSLRSEWVDEIRAATQETLDQVRQLPMVPPELEAVVAYGETWAEAMEDVEWEDGEVLVVGSSTVGAVARVFLGSRASKIVRHSPVPVIVVPRGAAADLAEQAERSEG